MPYSIYFFNFKIYGGLTEGVYREIRTSLFCFVQDIQVRVSIFLREGFQTHDGAFNIPISGHVPQGKISCTPKINVSFIGNI